MAFLSNWLDVTLATCPVIFLVNPLLPKDVANKCYKFAVFWSPTSQSYPKFETYVSFRIKWIIIPPWSIRWWRLSILKKRFFLRRKQSKSLIFRISSLVIQYCRRRFHENAEGSNKHEKKKKEEKPRDRFFDKIFTYQTKISEWQSKI